MLLMKQLSNRKKLASTPSIHISACFSMKHETATSAAALGRMDRMDALASR
jgi:hypothetical protein